MYAMRAERGQNLVEFALILPVVAVLMIGGYNLALLFLRFGDAGYLAQSAATTAARYGGYTPELERIVDGQVNASFLGGDRSHFTWRLQTRAGNGSLVCGTPTDSGGPGECTCNWGEQIEAVVRYDWQVNAVVYTWSGNFYAVRAALCWRGTQPAGRLPAAGGAQ